MRVAVYGQRDWAFTPSGGGDMQIQKAYLKYNLVTSSVCLRHSVHVQSSGHRLGKFARWSNLALVFEVVQSRPSTTFPESWQDYWKQYFRSFGWRICLPNTPNWRYRQNYDVNKSRGISRSIIGITRGHRWMALLAKHTKLIILILCLHATKFVKIGYNFRF